MSQKQVAKEQKQKRFNSNEVLFTKWVVMTTAMYYVYGSSHTERLLMKELHPLCLYIPGFSPNALSKARKYKIIWLLLNSALWQEWSVLDDVFCTTMNKISFCFSGNKCCSGSNSVCLNAVLSTVLLLLTKTITIYFSLIEKTEIKYKKSWNIKYNIFIQIKYKLEI